MKSRWPRKPLREIADVVMGQSPPGSSYNLDGKGEPLLNGPTEFGEHHPVMIQWTTAGTRFCQEGDILFCVRGSTTGRMNWADCRYSIGRGLAAIRAKSDECETSFLSLALTHLASDVIHKAVEGVFPNLNRDQLLDFVLPVPKPIEQRRLVERIGALTSRLEQARETRQAAFAEAENFVVSARKSIFSDEATESWEALPFPDATNRVQPRAGKLKTDEYHASGALPIVDQGQKLICGYTDDLARKFQGPLPVIVFGDHTRNVKFVDFDFAVGADGTVLLHSCDRIEPRFFYHWLCALELHNLGYSRHFKLLAETTVRFPADRNEQKRIAARLDTFAAKLDELQRLQREVETELASFTPALLAKAFRGEL